MLKWSQLWLLSNLAAAAFLKDHHYCHPTITTFLVMCCCFPSLPAHLWYSILIFFQENQLELLCAKSTLQRVCCITFAASALLNRLEHLSNQFGGGIWKRKLWESGVITHILWVDVEDAALGIYFSFSSTFLCLGQGWIGSSHTSLDKKEDSYRQVLLDSLSWFRENLPTYRPTNALGQQLIQTFQWESSIVLEGRTHLCGKQQDEATV